MTVKRYKVEPAGPDVGGDVLDFLKSAYAGRFNAADFEDGDEVTKRWRWFAAENPNAKDARTAWLCRDRRDGKIVGHLGIIPAALKCKDRCYPVVWGRDMIVLQTVRNMGIGTFMARVLMRDIKENGAIFLAAGLNESSYGLFRKMGFIDVGRIPLYISVNRWEDILRLKVRNRALARFLAVFPPVIVRVLRAPSVIWRAVRGYRKDITITGIDRFDESFDRLWDEVSHGFPVIVKRDMANLNWRFVDQPYRRYGIFKAASADTGRTRGYIVLRDGEYRGLKVGVISDLFAGASDPDTVMALLGFAIDHYRDRPDIGMIWCNMMHRNFEKALIRSGFIGVPSKPRLIVENAECGIDMDLAGRKENWFLTFADSDMDLSGASR